MNIRIVIYGLLAIGFVWTQGVSGADVSCDHSSSSQESEKSVADILATVLAQQEQAHAHQVWTPSPDLFARQDQDDEEDKSSSGSPQSKSSPQEDSSGKQFYSDDELRFDGSFTKFETPANADIRNVRGALPRIEDSSSGAHKHSRALSPDLRAKRPKRTNVSNQEIKTPVLNELFKILIDLGENATHMRRCAHEWLHEANNPWMESYRASNGVCLREIERIVREKSIDINNRFPATERFYRGWTSLHFVAHFDLGPQLVVRLVKSGACIDARNCLGEDALAVAYRAGHAETPTTECIRKYLINSRIGQPMLDLRGDDFRESDRESCDDSSDGIEEFPFSSDDDYENPEK